MAKVIILCGGAGTRLASLNLNVPKPLLEINNRPILGHIVKNCAKQGFTDIILKTGYGHDEIADYFKNGGGKYFKCDISYIQETEPMGTAGGLNCISLFKEPVFILYGDVLNEVNMVKMLEFHKKKKSLITVATQKSTHPEDADVLEIDSHKRIVKSIHKPGNDKHGNLTNAAMYIIEPRVFSLIPEKGKYDFGNDLVPLLIKKKFNIYSYYTDEWLFDVGTPERVIQAVKHYV